MYNILICDDEPVTCTYIEGIFSDYAKKNKIDIKVELFFNGQELLEYISKNSNIDLLFLDIELPDNSGAEVGKILRENLQNEVIQIVFISSKEKYAMQLFRIRPFDFLIKPLDEKMIIDVFEEYEKIYSKNRKFFEYKIGKQTEKILLSEIMYFMCDNRKICIVTTGEKIFFYGNMKKMRETFNEDGFWSVHNSFIINIMYVKLFRDREIVMCDGNVVPISNAYKKSIRKRLMELDEVKRDGRLG
ncbi:MAG: response regulator transcription factor [Lachnospiraceae bacterium]|nr:response regulator transcription factor [Lachnospiraceae bacterium]